MDLILAIYNFIKTVVTGFEADAANDFAAFEAFIAQFMPNE